MSSITAVWKESILIDQNQAAMNQSSTMSSKKQRKKKNNRLWIWRALMRPASIIWLTITHNHCQSKRRKIFNQLPLSISQPLPASITSTTTASLSLPSLVINCSQKRKSTISANTSNCSKQVEDWCYLVWSRTTKTQQPANNLPKN